MKNKKAAMELTMGTMVTIVLLMSVLILGLVLVKNIFSGGKEIVKMTDAQLKKEVNKLFSQDHKLIIYPDTRRVDIRQGKIDGVGIGIKNLLTGSSDTKKFSYVVEVSDPDLQRKCGVRALEVERWIVTGREENNIPIPSGDISTQKVLFDIPVGSPLCTIRFRVNVKAGTTTYATDFFDVTIKPK